MKNIHYYDDIIDMRYCGPRRHMRMEKSARAAQFAPFAALAGYDAAINETARLTDEETELCEDALEELDRGLAAVKSGDTVRVTYFKPDSRKDGGKYSAYEAAALGIDEYARVLRFCGGREIPLDSICGIEITKEKNIDEADLL